MTVLTQGANTNVSSNDIKVVLDWPTNAGGLDASAYLLTASGKVRGDADMVFFNQPSGADGALTVLNGAAGSMVFKVDLARLPASIERIVFCLTVDAASGARTLAAFDGASLAVAGMDGTPVATFDPDIKSASEAAMMVAELYRRGDGWKLKAIAQGFNGGLAPLARNFGIDVDEAAPAPAQAQAPAPVATPAPPPAAASAPRTISLSKITLDKAKPSVSLEKRGSDFGEISVNLNWTGGGKTGLFGKPKAVDLDLGCLFELADGRKGAVQALGRQFGNFRDEPYIELSGDDRTGTVAAGETMRINGRNWARIKRIAVFAFIYDGAPNWGSTDGTVTITMPDQPPVEIKMSDGPNGKGFCGLALIENDNGAMKLTRIVEYFPSHKQYDERLGWGMRWVSGSK